MTAACEDGADVPDAGLILTAPDVRVDVSYGRFYLKDAVAEWLSY
jgi:hypothetical protein